MAPRTLPGLGLSGFWDLGEDGWKDGMDVNLRILSALAQPIVLSRTTELPGVSQADDGDIYIVPDDAALNANDIAVFDNGDWVYLEPQTGWTAYVVDDAENVQFDGVDWIEFAAAGGGSSGGGSEQYVELSFFAGGTFEADEVIFSYLATQVFTLPSSLLGSYFVSDFAATAETILDIKKNNVSVGTLTWAAAGTTPTVSFASETSFAEGDRLTVVAPATPDATLASVTGSFLGDLV